MKKKLIGISILSAALTVSVLSFEFNFVSAVSLIRIPDSNTILIRMAIS